jgi:membrane protease YdiL (CAAX protease family)
MVDRVPSTPDQGQRHADHQQGQRELDGAQRHEKLDRAGRNLVQGIGQLDDEHGDEHRTGQEESIEPGEKSHDQQRGADQLGPGSGMTEEGRDSVVRGDVRGELAGTSGGADLGPAMRKEDQPGSDTQEQGRNIQGPGAHTASWRRIDSLVAPLAIFVCFYVATLILLEWLGFPFVQWLGLLAVCVATAGTIAIWDHGTWNLGLFVSPRLALAEFFSGSFLGAAVIGVCTLLVVLSSNIREEPGSGFPWLELVTTFLPAAFHEELLFRGYAFQRLYRWRRGFAIVFVALVFAGLHANNSAVTMLGLTNIFLGGVLLGLAYARFERLWFPIGLHTAWNLMTGPILGHEVSGYESMRTVFVERGTGPTLVTGGDFGLEGSIWMTAIEIAVIVALSMNFRRAPRVAGPRPEEVNQ